jgi:hypothetical protein
MFRPLILIPAGVLAALILLYTLGSSAESPRQDRLSQAIDNSQRTALRGHVRSPGGQHAASPCIADVSVVRRPTT